MQAQMYNNSGKYQLFLPKLLLILSNFADYLIPSTRMKAAQNLGAA